jgi:hypothetical protein
MDESFIIICSHLAHDVRSTSDDVRSTSDDVRSTSDDKETQTQLIVSPLTNIIRIDEFQEPDQSSEPIIINNKISKLSAAIADSIILEPILEYETTYSGGTSTDARGSIFENISIPCVLGLCLIFVYSLRCQMYTSIVVRK